MKIKDLLRRIIPKDERTLIRNLIRQCLYFFYPLPVKKQKIVFLNFDGKGFGGDPKYIYLEMVRKYPNFDYIWPLIDMNDEIPTEIRKVKWKSFQYYYEMATANIIITNTEGGGLSTSFKKKKGQYVIETWHGSHAFKYIEHEAAGILPKEYLDASDKSVSMTDVFISDGPACTRFYRNSFLCKCPIIETGMPREDIFYWNGYKALMDLKKHFNAQNKKILLYAPTFRDNGSTDGYNLNISRTLDALKQKFGGSWIVLLRLHPNASDTLLRTDNKNVFNVSRYGDVQELIAISDVCITDYSSIYHDFFVQKKPVFLYASDIKVYTKKDRQLRPEYFSLGLNIDETMESLIHDIQNYDFEQYYKVLDNYQKKTGTISDGKASYRVVNYISKYI